MRKLIILVILLISIATVRGECPELPEGKFPGWAARNTTGNLPINTPIFVEDFEIKVTNVISTDAVRILVLKHSSEYIRTSIQSGEDNRLKKDDLMIVLHSASGNVANLTVYTPRRANLSLASDVITETEKNYTVPNEVFTLKLTINNTGELEAKNIVLTPEFGDFEIIETNARTYNLCPSGTVEIEYKLKTPDVRKSFTYNLFLKIDYYDENIQLGRVQTHTHFYTIPIVIKSAVIEIERKTSNSTLDKPGRRVRVEVFLNNTGTLDAYNVHWEDALPAQIKLDQGTNVWSGRLLEGESKFLYYYITSNSPIMCSGVSRVSYEDRFGNSYWSFSDNTTIRFSPFLVLEKEINGIEWIVSPIKNIMNGETTWELDRNGWWGKNRSASTVVDSPRNVWINRTANVTVKILNKGNTVARGVVVKEVLEGLKAEGSTSWRGEVEPGEEKVLYSYTAEVIKHGNLTLRTDVGYLDVAPASLEYGREFDSKCACYCTDKLEEVNFSTKEKFYGLYPDMNISQPSELKVLSDCEFDMNITLEANGSDSIHDISMKIDTPLKIYKGQSYNYIDVLKARYYPDGTERDWSPTNVTYEYIFRTPTVEEKTNFTITTIAEYKDAFGNTFTRNSSTNIIVYPPLPPILYVVIEKKELEVSIDYANETDLEEYGRGIIHLRNKGFAPLENISIRIDLLRNLEIASNDTAWKGRQEATLTYANSTWYVFTGSVEWNGSLAVKEERDIYILLRGLKSGIYEIPYTVTFDGKETKGTFTLKVKGAILTIVKEVSNATIYEGEEINITVRVKNIGEAEALDVAVSDSVPVNFDLIEGTPDVTFDVISPGEEVVNEYRVRGLYEGIYPVDAAVVKWSDRAGNEYMKVSNELRVEIMKKEVKEKPEEVVKELKLSPKQAIVTSVFSIIILLVILKTLTLTKPVTKE
jgi:uncharacterized repeat protein (TIGR01451 family)